MGKNAVYNGLRVIICGCMLRVIELGGRHFQEGVMSSNSESVPLKPAQRIFPALCKGQVLSRSLCSQAPVIARESPARAAGQNSHSSINKCVRIFSAAHK